MIDSATRQVSNLKDTWVDDVVYGVSPVLAALAAGRRIINTLYVQESTDPSKRKDKTAIASAIAKAKELSADVKMASKHDLNMITENRPHQGLVLDASALDFEHVDAMPDVNHGYDGDGQSGIEDLVSSLSGTEAVAAEKEGTRRVPVWLCLDEVVDPVRK